MDACRSIYTNRNIGTFFALFVMMAYFTYVFIRGYTLFTAVTYIVYTQGETDILKDLIRLFEQPYAEQPEFHERFCIFIIIGL